MRNITQPVLISCLFAAGIAQSTAQNTVLNVVQELRFKLTAYHQMDDTENSKTLFRNAGKITITNKDIINLIDNELDGTFSPDAKLMLISRAPVDLNPKVVIRDRVEGDPVDTDVTQYFGAEVLRSIEDGKINKDPLKASGSSYDLIAFDFNLPPVDFRILGFGKTKVSTGKSEGEPAAVVHTGKMNASGHGTYFSSPPSVSPAVLTGTVEISGTDVKASVE